MTYHRRDELFQQALELKKQRRYHEALPLYEELLREEYRSAFFLSSAAHLFFLLKDYDRALPLVESSLAMRSDEPFTLSLKGKILMRLGSRDEAFRIFSELSSLDSAPGAARDVVTFLSRSGAADEAIAYLNRIIDRLPAHRELLALKADLLRTSGKPGDEASNIAPHTSSGEGDHESYARNIEIKLRDLSQEEALEEMRILLSIPSRRENTSLLNVYAKTLYNARRYAEAYGIYQEIITKAPHDRFILSQMAFSLVHQGDYIHAIPLLEKISVYEPENLYVRSALMKAYRITGTMEEGAEFFKGMMARYPAMKNLWGLVKKLSSTPGEELPPAGEEEPESTSRTGHHRKAGKGKGAGS